MLVVGTVRGTASCMSYTDLDDRLIRVVLRNEFRFHGVLNSL